MYYEHVLPDAVRDSLQITEIRLLDDQSLRLLLFEEYKKATEGNLCSRTRGDYDPGDDDGDDDPHGSPGTDLDVDDHVKQISNPWQHIMPCVPDSGDDGPHFSASEDEIFDCDLPLVPANVSCSTHNSLAIVDIDSNSSAADCDEAKSDCTRSSVKESLTPEDEDSIISNLCAAFARRALMTVSLQHSTSEPSDPEVPSESKKVPCKRPREDRSKDLKGDGNDNGDENFRGNAPGGGCSGNGSNGGASGGGGGGDDDDSDDDDKENQATVATK